jgi:hypothetical protein
MRFARSAMFTFLVILVILATFVLNLSNRDRSRSLGVARPSGIQAIALRGREPPFVIPTMRA